MEKLGAYIDAEFSPEELSIFVIGCIVLTFCILFSLITGFICYFRRGSRSNIQKLEELVELTEVIGNRIRGSTTAGGNRK